MGCCFVKQMSHANIDETGNPSIQITCEMVEEGNNISMESKADPEVIQYVREVTDFSSQYGSETSISYTATNVVGRGTIYPNYGDFTQACVFRTYGTWWRMAPSARKNFKRTPPTFLSEDFIELEFDLEVYPTKIEIYETYNPGAVVRILACDTSGTDVDHGRVRWQVLWEGEPQRCSHTSRVFQPELRFTMFRTNLIRLEFCHTLCEYYTELDFVSLSGSLKPHEKQKGHRDVPVVTKAGENSTIDQNILQIGTDLKDLSLFEVNLVERIKDSPEQTSSEMIQLEVLNRQDSEALNNGYFDILPEEVIQLILSYLDIPSLCRACQTSRLFHQHCYDSLQYKELDLQCHWTQVNNFALESLHSRCRFLHHLNMSWCGGKNSGLTGDAFKRLLRHCGPELYTLYLSCCKFVVLDVLQGITNYCPALQELDLASCTNITDFKPITKLIQLVRLNLYRTAVNMEAISAIISSCNQLRHLNLGSCSRIADFDDVACLLACHCKNLQSLDLWRNRNISDIGLLELSTHCKQLQELDLGWCSDLRSNSHCFINLVKGCPNLKKLYITANRTVCDDDLNAIAKYSPLMEQLDILGTRQVSERAVLRVLENCPKLKMFDVSFCANIDFPILETWKVQFPHCDIKKSYQY